MSAPSSPAAARRLPSVSRADGSGGHRATTSTTCPSSVDRLLADIAFQWQKERRRRAAGRPGRRRRCDGQTDVMTTSMTETEKYDDDDNDNNCEAASAYWWTDVFLRYFVFDDDDGAKSTVTADSDDLLFFVRRRRHGRRNNKRRLPSAHQRRRRIAYETRAYRKQQHRRSQQQQQPNSLPIGDPTVLWRHTVCLNTIVHRLRYTLTVAVCVHVPRKSAAAGTDCSGWEDQDAEDFEFDEDPDDRDEYDLQLLSRYVHTVYASTSCRRMDAAKGPRERPVYPAVCWTVEDYAEAFRTVIVQPGQTVCAELVAAWPGSTVIEERDSGDDEDGCEERVGRSTCRRKTAAISVRQNRAVLFAAAVPYAAVRATYECKMSVYREAERQRRKQHKRGGGKKSSLGATLSASLTALFTGDKGPSGSAHTQDSYSDDLGCYYGMPTSATDRIEYVTVRGCIPGCDVGWYPDNEDVNLDNDSLNSSDVYNSTKGLGQMAVTLAPVQPSDPLTPSHEHNSTHQAQHHHYDGGADCGRDERYGYDDYSGGCCGGDDDGDDDECRQLQQQQLQQRPVAVESPYASSEPGDFYDYGWDYETAASSGHHTPQTPTHHYHQRRQQCRYLDRQRRRRRRRLSDPCSTSVYELLYGQPNHQPTAGQPEWCSAVGGRRRRQPQGHGQHQPAGGYGFGYGAPETPVQWMANKPPHRAWSESDGLDRCGSGDGGFGSRQPQKSVLLPPPPVPYYCAAEAAASGFTQFVRKSPSGWWAREKNRRLTERGRRKRRRQRSQSAASSRRRSASAGGNGSGGCCGSATDDNDDGDSDLDGGCSSSDDEADSDGEFVGALAAAAAVGHDPDREWERLGVAGDPVADWERFGDRSDSADSAAEQAAMRNDAANGGDAVEWTTEIVASDLRRSGPVRNESVIVAPSRTTIAQVHDSSWWCGGLSPAPPAFVTANHQLQQQQCAFSQSSQQRHRRPPPPQFRPQPAEPPPPPPALSVSFTAVACPWWTILEDVLLVTSATTSSGAPLSTSAPGFPLLTFD